MQIYYYEDELKDEFSKAKIIPRKIDKNYDYSQKTYLKKFLHRFCYTVVAKPVAWCFLKIKYHHKIIGKEIESKYRPSGTINFYSPTHFEIC